jgi:hypothetical protein
MKKALVGILLCGAVMSLGVARDTSIRGDYLEVRTADVYVGACFANSEVGLTGKEALMAWSVREGSWQGTPLEGLSVIAVIKAKATLGDPHSNPYPARAILLVDEKARPAQQQALINFVHSMAGDLLHNVVRIESSQIDLQVNPSDGGASLKAGDIAQIKTRSIHKKDHLCANEEVYYPPLTEVSDAVPAYTLVHQFRGQGLGTRWSLPGKRAAFIGVFSR